MVLLREEIGDVLRGARQRQGRTLRDVSSSARVSLGYLSEVERGQKEASSELLLSICEALDVPMSSVLRSVSDRVAMSESLAARLTPEPAGPGVPRGERPTRPVDGIRKTVIPAPVPADDDLAPVA
jgi:transcriptional regulator with XRE-family HTH domain